MNLPSYELQETLNVKPLLDKHINEKNIMQFDVNLIKKIKNVDHETYRSAKKHKTYFITGNNGCLTKTHLGTSRPKNNEDISDFSYYTLFTEIRFDKGKIALIKI